MRSDSKGALGKKLMIASLLIGIIDRVTSVFSTTIGMIICGDDYMCPVGGVVCDLSCGFNTDMHLSFILVLFFILGLILYVSSKKGKTDLY